jgi:hypothetical protein
VSQFADHADRLVAFVSEGLTMRDGCARAGLSYDTARKWVSAGRRDPNGAYGAFVTALDAARCSSEAEDEDFEPGPVERQVEILIAGRELDGEAAIAAAQAQALARTVDTLSRTRGGSAGLALASVSRRLEECVGYLRLQPKDALTELQERRAARIAGLIAEGKMTPR